MKDVYLFPVIKLRTIDGREIVRKLSDVSKAPNEMEGPFDFPNGLPPLGTFVCVPWRHGFFSVQPREVIGSLQ